MGWFMPRKKKRSLQLRRFHRKKKRSWREQAKASCPKYCRFDFRLLLPVGGNKVQVSKRRMRTHLCRIRVTFFTNQDLGIRDFSNVFHHCQPMQNCQPIGCIYSLSAYNSFSGLEVKRGSLQRKLNRPYYFRKLRGIEDYFYCSRRSAIRKCCANILRRKANKSATQLWTMMTSVRLHLWVQ